MTVFFLGYPAVPSSRRLVVPSSRRLVVPQSRSLVVSSSRSPAVPLSRRLVGALPSHSQSFSVVLSHSRAPAIRAPQSIAPLSHSRAPVNRASQSFSVFLDFYHLLATFLTDILKKIKKSCVRIFTDQNYFITLPRFCDERKPLAEEPQNWHPRISRWLSQIPRFLQTKRC